jgi:hypothetical protein
MLSELHSLNLKLCSKQYNKKFVLHLIVAPQLGGGQRHNYSTKTRQAGCANEQSMYSLMCMVKINKFLIKVFIREDISSKISNVKLTLMTFIV